MSKWHPCFSVFCRDIRLRYHDMSMMTSSNGNIFRVTGHLCGEFTGHRWIPLTKASDAEFDVFFDLRRNKRLSKQSWGWWFETLSRPIWRPSNGKLFYTCLYVWFHIYHTIDTYGTEWLFSSFYQHWLTLISAWTSNYIDYTVCGEIAHPFPNFNGDIVEVWEWTGNFIPHFIRYVITYPCCVFKLIHIGKRNPSS